MMEAALGENPFDFIEYFHPWNGKGKVGGRE